MDTTPVGIIKTLVGTVTFLMLVGGVLQDGESDGAALNWVIRAGIGVSIILATYVAWYLAGLLGNGLMVAVAWSRRNRQRWEGANALQIAAAWYGDPDGEGGGVMVSHLVAERVNGALLDMWATTAELGGEDPAPGYKKVLDVEYVLAGVRGKQRFHEQDRATIPAGAFVE